MAQGETVNDGVSVKPGAETVEINFPMANHYTWDRVVEVGLMVVFETVWVLFSGVVMWTQGSLHQVALGCPN